jgi:uncharacterized protein YbjT (DUF2867 family)
MNGPLRSGETVVVAGASGYIGRALGPLLGSAHTLIGLSRSQPAPLPEGYDSWRSVDFFSLRDAERGLQGADRAVYLIHSMSPGDRLTQGSFDDLDLICADNFGRAARAAGVKQIVYVGGIAPGEDRELSRHLRSRLETEVALSAYGVPVTSLRAALVIGAGGSSFSILEKLVRRLPAMVCPAWTNTPTQPIALADVVALVGAVLGREDMLGATFDIGGPDVLTYRELMAETAAALGLRRPMFSVPFLTTGLSRLWVTLITGAPMALVKPLVESLSHLMVASGDSLSERLGVPSTPIRAALRAALGTKSVPRDVRQRPNTRKVANKRVRSVQRMPRPADLTAGDAVRDYLSWLSRLVWPLLTIERDGDETKIRARLFGTVLLQFTLLSGRSTPDREVLIITGGALADVTGGANGRLDFRIVGGGAHLLVGLHDFVPRLPWPLYVTTQAQLHRLVMALFQRRLGRLARAS